MSRPGCPRDSNDAGQCSYGHLAEVFREALVKARRIEDALRVLDGYRVLMLPIERSLLSETSKRVAEVFAIDIGRLLGARGISRASTDAYLVLSHIPSIRGWSSIQIAILFGTDDTSIRRALDEVTHRPSLVTVARRILEPDVSPS